MGQLTFSPRLFLLASFLIFAMSSPAFCDDETPICGVIESSWGDVQVFDSTRTQVLDQATHSALPCGSWISVNVGWAIIRHQKGPQFHMSSQSFLQLLGPESEFKNDDLLLYRGQVYVHAVAGSGEFRLISANGRMRIKKGKAIYIFNPAANESQLIAIEKSATLENRYQFSKKVEVHAGESTVLHFKLLRVLPTYPKAVAVASLKTKLALLKLSEKDQSEAIRAVVQRRDRRIAGGSSHEVTRNLASIPSETENSKSYLRHQSSPVDAELHSLLVKQVTGGANLGKEALFPNKDHEEKKRLIKELSEIQEE